MTKYREIIRLVSLSLSQTNIALSCGVSKKTVNKVLKAAREKGISWPLDPNQTDAVIEQLLFPKKNSPQSQSNSKGIPGVGEGPQAGFPGGSHQDTAQRRPEGA